MGLSSRTTPWKWSNPKLSSEQCWALGTYIQFYSLSVGTSISEAQNKQSPKTIGAGQLQRLSRTFINNIAMSYSAAASFSVGLGSGAVSTASGAPSTGAASASAGAASAGAGGFGVNLDAGAS